MNRGPAPKKTLSPAHIAGFAAFLLSGLLLFVREDIAAWPLGLFLLFCLVAPFLPRAGLFLPVISRGRKDRRAVALTFDDGPDPDVTPLLLDLLLKHRLLATFFVAGKNAQQHPALIREILLRGHTIGNHSYHHDPLLMMRSRAKLADEITRTQNLLARSGIRPLAFRPPVGITNSILPEVLGELHMECVTFSCRACDFGNRRITGLAGTILRKIRPGAIVLLHDVSPPGGGRTADWLRGVEKIILGLKSRGYDVVPLPQLIGRPVMEELSVLPMKKPFRQELSQLSGTADQLTASASVPGDSAWYAGHFPGNPILPGIAILALVEEAIITSELREGRRVMITGVGRVRFRLPVKPDDRITLKITREKKRDGLAYLFAVSLAGEPACSGIFTMQICGMGG
jgi:peptidoglycan/xylan/chitin deacetylase (PgdA/CDA1 family)/3-hydroxymyristoyl/3-hydroxydecanoyl-(acyl carrier protein) dehydratase